MTEGKLRAKVYEKKLNVEGRDIGIVFVFLKEVDER